jgi:hypothetical protein
VSGTITPSLIHKTQKLRAGNHIGTDFRFCLTFGRTIPNLDRRGLAADGFPKHFSRKRAWQITCLNNPLKRWRQFFMFLPITVFLALAIFNAGLIFLVVYGRQRHQKRARRVRQLERTVEKLKKKNGQLWYDVIKARQQTGAFENSDLTLTGH